MPVISGRTSPLAWDRVWVDAAALLTEHFDAGRGHLLTEDSLRMCTVRALEASGVAPHRLAAEVPVAALGRGKVDLTVDWPDGTVIELKYPRDSRTGVSPDTMTFGELVRDFLRVALVPAQDRWVVQIVNARLLKYVRDICARHEIPWSHESGSTVTLDRDALGRLPKTALTAIGDARWILPVSATLSQVLPISHGLSLFAYHVAAPSAGIVPAALVSPSARESADQQVPTPTRRTPLGGGVDDTGAIRASNGGTARAEILAAVDRVVERSGEHTVTVAQVLHEMRRSGSRYADSTVRTMMTSHMCVDAQGPGIGSYDDLERIDRGRYRRRTTTQDDT